MSEPEIVGIRWQQGELTFLDKMGLQVRSISTPAIGQYPSVELSESIVVAGGDERGEGSCHFVIFDLQGNILHKQAIPKYPISFAIDDSEQKIACGLDEGLIAVFIWNGESCVNLHVLASKSTRGVKVVHWLNDDRLCSGNYDGLIKIWDASTGDCLQTVQEIDVAHIGIFSLVHSSKYPDLLFSGHRNGCLTKWNIQNGNRQQIKPHVSWVKSLIIDDESATIIYGNVDRVAIAFDIDTFEEKWKYSCDICIVEIGCGNNEVYVALQDASIVVLDVATGALIRTAPMKLEVWLAIKFVRPRNASISRMKFVD